MPAVVCLAATAVFLAGNAFALEPREIKAAADKAGNWLIEQFDLKEKVFGKGEQAKDVETVAMCVTALCNHPRDYKETSGPFISEPVKYILSQINEDGTLKGDKLSQVAYTWVIVALTATKNEAYTQFEHKCLAGRNRSLGPASCTPDFIIARVRCLVGCQKLMHDHGIELPLDTPKHENATALLKLQDKDGSFDADVKKTAMALGWLNFCYNPGKR
ncbi:MAG: hypothetical protein ABSE73_02290 [Planctomycetota bacterium]